MLKVIFAVLVWEKYWYSFLLILQSPEKYFESKIALIFYLSDSIL